MRSGLRVGLTLVELLLVMVVLAVLAAVLVPSLASYAQDARTSEAVQKLKVIGNGASAYFFSEHTAKKTQKPKSLSYLEANLCTAGNHPRGEAVSPEETYWALDSWRALKFEIRHPHYFQYCYRSWEGDTQFSAWADASLKGEGETDTRYCLTGKSEGGQPLIGGPKRDTLNRKCKPR